MGSTSSPGPTEPGRPYGTSDYLRKWALWNGSPLEPAALRTRTFAHGRLQLAAVPFTVSADHILDHIKYLAMSTKRFPIPVTGSLTLAANLHAAKPGATAGRVLRTTGRALLEGQQAAATLHLFNLDETGQLYDWFVSEHQAFALYERLFVPGVGRDQMTHFTIGHGLFSLLDEFPFNQLPDQQVSIPVSERLFGQGVRASFDHVTVATVTHP